MGNRHRSLRADPAYDSVRTGLLRQQRSRDSLAVRYLAVRYLAVRCKAVAAFGNGHRARAFSSRRLFMGRQFDVVHGDRTLKICVLPVDEAWELWLCERRRRLAGVAAVPGGRR